MKTCFWLWTSFIFPLIKVSYEFCWVKELLVRIPTLLSIYSIFQNGFDSGKPLPVPAPKGLNPQVVCLSRLLKATPESCLNPISVFTHWFRNSPRPLNKCERYSWLNRRLWSVTRAVGTGLPSGDQPKASLLRAGPAPHPSSDSVFRAESCRGNLHSETPCWEKMI